MDNELFTWHTTSDTIEDLIIGFNLALTHGAKSLMVLTCADNHYPENSLNGILKSSVVPIFGGIYPIITLQDTLIKQGAIIVGFSEAYEVTAFSKLNQNSNEEALEQLITSTLDKRHQLHGKDNFLMFYDGLMPNIEDFIDCLFESLDHRISIAGGGAGYLDFIQRPCVFTHHGMQDNIVLLVSLPQKLITNVAHGWKIFQGPFLVSEAEGQTVQGLNYQPAFDVYSSTIEDSSDYTFTNDNFFEIAKHFPLGIKEINNNLIVRDPILAEHNNLQCVGKVPLNSMVYLLEGDIPDLVSAAENAAKQVYSSVSDSELSASMVFDCISRVLYMEDDFDKELQAISKHSTTDLFGVLSIGEIANSQSGAIRLLNKSTVISAW